MKNKLVALSLVALLVVPCMKAEESVTQASLSAQINSLNAGFKTLRAQSDQELASLEGEQEVKEEKQGEDAMKFFTVITDCLNGDGCDVTQEILDTLMNLHLNSSREDMEFKSKLALKYGPQLTALQEKKASLEDQLEEQEKTN